MVENAEAEGKAAASKRQMEWAVEIERFDADGGIECGLQCLDPSHAVVIGGRIIDRAHAAAERLEQECQIAIAAAEIQHGMVADERFQKAAAAGEQLIEQGQG